ncbi:MAG: hypothetical protein M0033_01470 [Nitrospiraceae bacterium]|nr:hypothetical protein [Nitrospiraceae bacterium]
MDVRVRINGRTFLLSEDEFMKLVLGMTPANPVDVLDFIGGNYRGGRQRCRSPLSLNAADQHSF